jgi:hypothetical protein
MIITALATGFAARGVARSIVRWRLDHVKNLTGEQRKALESFLARSLSAEKKR